MPLGRQIARIDAALAGPLQRDGFACWVVGGYVRDSLRGHAPQDIDLATDADPVALQAWLSRANLRRVTDATALAHGTFKVFVPGLKTPIDIACLRQDVARLGPRHARVVFTQDLHADLARRDFTINAMAMPWPPGPTVVDPFGGRVDLVNKTVRFVGEAVARIHEDPLRLLRMARMAALDADWRVVLDPAVVAARASWPTALGAVAKERQRDEILKAMGRGAPSNFWHVAHQLGLAHDLLEPLGLAGVDVAIIDAAIKHGCEVLARLSRHDANPALALAAVALGLCDRLAAAGHWRITKCESLGPGLPHLGAPGIALGVAWAKHLHLPHAVAQHLSHRIGHAFWPQGVHLAGGDTAAAMVYMSSLAMGTPHPAGALEQISALQAARGDAHEAVFAHCRALLAQGRALRVADLAISGHDLIEWGTPPGPAIATMLHACLRHVQAAPEANTKVALKSFLVTQTL